MPDNPKNDAAKGCSNKFVRREDLTPQIRMCIALTALMAMTFGMITHLAREFMISRTFVYMLVSKLEVAGHLIFGISAACLR